MSTDYKLESVASSFRLLKLLLLLELFLISAVLKVSHFSIWSKELKIQVNTDIPEPEVKWIVY